MLREMWAEHERLLDPWIRAVIEGDGTGEPKGFLNISGLRIAAAPAPLPEGVAAILIARDDPLKPSPIEHRAITVKDVPTS
jgi:hypothetical protein